MTTPMRTVLYTSDQARNAGFVGHLHFHCSVCQQIKPTADTGGTGYAVSSDDNLLVCYECCARRDRWTMQAGKPIVLYFSQDKSKPVITNWPGTLSFSVTHYRRFNHPFAREAYCGEFKGPDGRLWRFKNIGDSQIAHCKRAA